jgi:hypothetical protein
LAGTRTSGVTAGASDPAVRICFRLRRYSQRILKPLRVERVVLHLEDDPVVRRRLNSIAVCGSACANDANAGRPSCHARMMLFKRPMSGSYHPSRKRHEITKTRNPFAIDLVFSCSRGFFLSALER